MTTSAFNERLQLRGSSMHAWFAFGRLMTFGIATLGCAFIVAICGSPAIAASAEPVERFTVDATIRPVGVTADGRFTLEASARYAPEAKSADGRYALKAVNVPAGGCAPALDAIFASGFEL